MTVTFNTNSKLHTREVLEKFTLQLANRKCKKLTLNDERTVITIDTDFKYYAYQLVEMFNKYVAHNLYFDNKVKVSLDTTNR